MAQQHQHIQDQLDLIVAEMKTIGFWSDQEPEQDLSQIASYLDVPDFANWLQFVFVPAVQKALDTGDLPSKSMVGVMAMRQYDYHSQVPEALHLVELLHRFDELVNELPK
jgi:uncharacterized protein YqcC (DUF446 family)